MSLQPQDIVRCQEEAYNRKDLEAFVDCYSDDVECFRFPEKEPFLRGKLSFRERYQSRFSENESLNAVIKKRIVLGRRVVDHEVVFGSSFGEISLVAIYELNERDKICRVDFIYP